MNQESSESEPTVSLTDSYSKVFGTEHSGRVRGVGFGPSPSLVFGLPSQQPGGVSFESSRGCLTQSKMDEKVQNLESNLNSERQKRHLMEVELQSELQKEREKRMAMEGVIAAAFQQKSQKELPI